MEKRKWLWKRKSSERSPGETESSGSISSHSERYSDDREAFKESSSPNNSTKSPEVSSKASAVSEDVNESTRSLTEKLSAALVNISAKEDLVKQHAKVAEEAIAGWETAENEVVVLKQKLEAATQQNSALEERVSHLDGALKECVRQLRQAREEQEKKINDAVAKTTRDWETTKFELESQLLELQDKAESVKSNLPPHFSPDLLHKIEALKKENLSLKLELSSQLEELEIRTIERDLSTQAAETASKQHLESIKKVAKLDAECRRLKAIGCKSSFVSGHKSPAASSIYVESLTDSQSENGERLNVVNIDTHKMSEEANKREPSCSDSWASALIAELDQFKNEKVISRTLPGSSFEIDLMDDFLEMEQLAAVPETKNKNQYHESKDTVKQFNDVDSLLKVELEAMIHRMTELEEKLEKIELEKADLEIALAKSQENLESKATAKQSNDGDSLLKVELEAMIHRTTLLEEKLEKIEVEKAELEIALAKSQESLESIAAIKQSNEGDSSLKVELETMIHRTMELEEKLEKIEVEKVELQIALVKSQESLESKATDKQSNDGDSSLKIELEAMIHRTMELEEKLEKMEVEKAELENALAKSHESLESKATVKQTNECDRLLKVELEAMIHRTMELEEKLEKIEVEKAELETALVKSQESLESKATIKQSNGGDSSLEVELEAMIHRTTELEEKWKIIEVERAELEIALAKSQDSLEASKLQLRNTKIKLEDLQRDLCMANEVKQHLESQLGIMETDAETMSAKIDALGAEIEKEKALSVQISVNANESKQLLESQLVSIEAEARMMSAKINSLQTEVENERALSAQITVKCKELEEELSRKRHEAELQQTANSNVEVKIKQEDLAVAAGKLVECQKTIASLGQQLKSLATLEDFLIDTTSIPEFSRGGSLTPKSGEPWKLHSNETYSPKPDPESTRVSADHSVPPLNKNDANKPPSSSSSSSIVSSNHASSEKNRNGFAKFFTRSKNGIQLEI